MKSTVKWFILIVAAQALFLLGWAGYHEWVRQHAPTILLRAYPVDPQDLLRGDYMILRYDISSVSGVTEKHGKSVVDRDVWVVLAQVGDYHQVVRTTSEKPELKTGEVLVRADRGHSSNRSDAEQLLYGIERFYVPEGKGTPAFKKIEAEVSVSPAHRLYIKRVLIDGEEYP